MKSSHLDMSRVGIEILSSGWIVFLLHVTNFMLFFFSFTPSFFQPARFVFSFYVSNGCRLVALPFP